jgi:FtsP/CotA-like multicopper oxidase with cupredoxin domain
MPHPGTLAAVRATAGPLAHAAPFTPASPALARSSPQPWLGVPCNAYPNILHLNPTPYSLGIARPGPLIYASPGEVVRVLFRNLLPFAASLELRGLVAKLGHGGSATVQPGATVSYTWRVRVAG